MSPIASIKLRHVFIFMFLQAILSGCGITPSPTKRKPLQISPLKTSLAPDPRAILVRFESTLPGWPLVETVWDNVSGAYADADESKQIGFSQDYGKAIGAGVVGALSRGPAGAGLAAGAAMKSPDYTRIVVPFGRIFEGVLESGLRNAFPSVGICTDERFESEKLKSVPNTPVVRIKVVEFQVWENPLNHLNMKAQVECTFPKRANSDTPESHYTARREVMNRSMGSVMTTSSGFIRQMNKLSNEFAAELCNEILPVIQTRTGN